VLRLKRIQSSVFRIPNSETWALGGRNRFRQMPMHSRIFVLVLLLIDKQDAASAAGEMDVFWFQGTFSAFLPFGAPNPLTPLPNPQPRSQNATEIFALAPGQETFFCEGQAARTPPPPKKNEINQNPQKKKTRTPAKKLVSRLRNPSTIHILAGYSRTLPFRGAEDEDAQTVSECVPIIAKYYANNRHPNWNPRSPRVAYI